MKLKEKILDIFKKRFIRNVIILSSGTAGAQIIGVLLSPVITRLYGPEAYGLMGTFMAIVAIIAPISALTYPISIVLPKGDKDAKGLVKLSVIITLVISTIIGLLLLFFNNQIITLLGIEEIGGYIYLLPIVILFAGFYEVIEQWFIRMKKFSVSAKATLIQSIVVNGSKVGIGLYYPAASVLIVISAIQQGIRALLLLFFSDRTNRKKLISSLNEKISIRRLAKKYKDFPLFRAPEVLFNAISNSLPIILLTSFFGPATAGFYQIGRRVLQLPSELIGKAVGDVFYPRISEAANNGENLTNLIIRSTLMLSLIGVIPFGIVILFGPWLFGLVFGTEWVLAGEYARWMALWLYFGFINRTSVRALPVLNAQAFHLAYTIIRLIVRVSVLAIAFFVFNSDIVAIILIGISGALLNFGLTLITLSISRKFDRSNRGYKR